MLAGFKKNWANTSVKRVCFLIEWVGRWRTFSRPHSGSELSIYPSYARSNLAPLGIKILRTRKLPKIMNPIENQNVVLFIGYTVPDIIQVTKLNNTLKQMHHSSN